MATSTATPAASAPAAVKRDTAWLHSTVANQGGSKGFGDAYIGGRAVGRIDTRLEDGSLILVGAITKDGQNLSVPYTKEALTRLVTMLDAAGGLRSGQGESGNPLYRSTLAAVANIVDPEMARQIGYSGQRWQQRGKRRASVSLDTASF